MPQEKSLEDLPAFLDTGTLRDMSAVATKVATARSFADEIIKSENEVLSGVRDKREFGVIADMALEAAKYARQAISILKNVKHNAETFEGMVRHAAG